MNRRFNICEKKLENIYQTKINSSYDKVIAKFNHTHFNNLLCIYRYVSK